MKFKIQKGITLIELLLVVAIIMIIGAGAIMTSGALGDQLKFVSAYRNSEGFVSEARNRALTGESYVDEDDYDGDGDFDDLILPNGYIVNFELIDGVYVVSLYVDLLTNNSIPGQLDTADDMFLKSVELADDIEIELLAQDKFGAPEAGIDETNFSLLYKTPDAAFEVINFPQTSIQLKLMQVDGEGNPRRTKYLFMHYLYGIPEILNDEYL